MKIEPGWLLNAARDAVCAVAGETNSLVVAAELERRWGERHRHWHGPGHLMSMLAECADDAEREVLSIAAVWHDAIYDPTRADNEERSAELMARHAAQPDGAVVRRAYELVLASKWQVLPGDPLTARFFEFDTRQLSSDCPPGERARYERGIFREYQFARWQDYRAKRSDFLGKWRMQFPQHTAGVDACLTLLHSALPRIALYPGSFNPFHRGHLSVLRQAEQSFDKVIIGVGINRQKSHAADAELAQRMNERLERVRSQLRFHEVMAFDGLLTDFLGGFDSNVTVVRGVRDGTDLEAELRYSRFLRDLRPETSVVWIGCDAQLQHVSSSAVRELESIAPGSGIRYVPGISEIYGLVD